MTLWQKTIHNISKSILNNQYYNIFYNKGFINMELSTVKNEQTNHCK